MTKWSILNYINHKLDTFISKFCHNQRLLELGGQESIDSTWIIEIEKALSNIEP